MYCAMIVDDEPLMLHYLETNLEKMVPGWKVCGCAQNGIQALELLEQGRFDLVITDIRMPEMDGLHLAEQIRIKYSKLKVILLTGHNDFQYARQAIRSGVFDYLLKPLVDAELIQTLHRISELLHSEEVQTAAVHTLKTLSNQSIKDVKAKLLLAVISENHKEINALYPALHKMQVSLLDGWGAILLLRPDILKLNPGNMPEENRLLYQIMLREFCEELEDESLLFCEDLFGNMAFLVTSEKEEYLAEQAAELKEILERSYCNPAGIPLAVSMGDAANDMFALSESYTSALDGFITGSGTINDDCTRGGSKCGHCVETIRDTCQQILASLKKEDPAGMLMGIRALIASLGQPLLKEACIWAAFGFSSGIAYRESTYANQFESALFHLVRTFFDVEAENAEALTEPEATSAYMTFLHRLAGDGSYMPVSGMDTNLLAENAREYICLHYHEPLSLALLADRFGCTPSYLSDVFHKNIGESYSKFLTKIRMEQSARILRSEPQAKIYSVAEQVGFVSVKHFNAVFKKYYGVSPKDYLRL